MNIYDFDNTILDGDSSYLFIKYSIFRHPFKVTWCLLKGFFEFIKGSPVGNIKEKIFSFVKTIPALDEYVDTFILKNIKRVKRFYLERQKEDDVVISATFDFIIIPFCKKLGIKSAIATKYDVKKGKIIGFNCKGKEKINRFRKIYPDAKVMDAYSDSYSDDAMFQIASHAYLVKKDKITTIK